MIKFATERPESQLFKGKLTFKERGVVHREDTTEEAFLSVWALPLSMYVYIYTCIQLHICMYNVYTCRSFRFFELPT